MKFNRLIDDEYNFTDVAEEFHKHLNLIWPQIESKLKELNIHPTDALDAIISIYSSELFYYRLDCKKASSNET